MLLSEFLFQHYNKKVVILIDEYDTPINSASTQDRDGIAKLMSNLLGSCLKDNNNSWLPSWSYTVLYYPWSIINCINRKKFGSYWLDSSNNEIIDSFLDRSDTEVKVIISKLIQGESATVPFEKYVTFNDLDSGKQRALWSLWFNCGYLTLDSAAEFRSNTDELHVCIPSSEIKAPQN